MTLIEDIAGVDEIVEKMTSVDLSEESDESLASMYQLLSLVTNHGKPKSPKRKKSTERLTSRDLKISANFYQTENYAKIHAKIKSSAVDVTEVSADSRRPAALFFPFAYSDKTFRRCVASTTSPGLIVELLEGSTANLELQLFYEGLFSLTLSQHWQDVLGFSVGGNKHNKMRLTLKHLSGPSIQELIDNRGKLCCRSDLFKYWARQIAFAFEALDSHCHLYLSADLTLNNFFVETQGVDVICSLARFSEEPGVDLFGNFRALLEAMAEEASADWPEDLKEFRAFTDFANSPTIQAIDFEAMLADCDTRKHKENNQSTNL